MGLHSHPCCAHWVRRTPPSSTMLMSCGDGLGHVPCPCIRLQLPQGVMGPLRPLLSVWGHAIYRHTSRTRLIQPHPTGSGACTPAGHRLFGISGPPPPEYSHLRTVCLSAALPTAFRPACPPLPLRSRGSMAARPTGCAGVLIHSRAYGQTSFQACPAGLEIGGW